MFNEFVDSIDENEGTITFTCEQGNLFDKELNNVRISSVIKNNTIFILERYYNNFRFIQSDPNYPTKIASLDISQFLDCTKIYFAVSWSRENNYLYIGDALDKSKELAKAESVNSTVKFRTFSDNSIVQIGDESIEVSYYRITSNGQTILQPSAKEILDFQLHKVKQLLENCKSADFQFEVTLIQQAIVLLATIFEVYTQERFKELEEQNTPNIEGLYDLIPEKWREKRKQEYCEEIKGNSLTHIQIFIQNKKINFQNWEDSKKAYNKVYGIKFSEMNINNSTMEQIQVLLKYRHKIIHSKDDMTIVNIDKVPGEEPIFCNQEYGEKAYLVFKEFLYQLHNFSTDV